jgi:hypothetical protein
MAKGKKTGGRQKGTPNKSTVKAIEDMAIMLDLNPDANPVEFLLAIMRCPDLQLLTRMKAAKDVLPYVLPSLQSIAHTGDKDKPIAIVDQFNMIDIARRIAFVLHQGLRAKEAARATTVK